MQRFRLSKTQWFVLALSLLLSVLIGGGHFLSSQAPREGSFAGLDLFSQVFSHIELRYVDSVDPDVLMEGAYQALVESTDPYSSYLSPELFAAMQLAPPAGDVGLSLIKHNGMAVIAAVRRGSPAEEAGLREGQVLRAVGSRPTRKMPLAEAVLALRGAPGSEVELSVIEWEEAAESQHTLRREIFKSPAFDLDREKHARRLAVHAFEPGLSEAVAKALRSLSAPEETLLLDLRHTASSEFEEALRLADLFVETGPLARVKTSQSEDTRFDENPNPVWTGRILVLADGTTSGAGELFAQALRHAGRAELWGTRTGGRGLAQTLVPLKHGGGLWISTMEYLAPDGTRIEREGLEPDRKVENDRATDEDELLTAVREALATPSPETTS